MFRKMPVVLLAIILLMVCFNPWIPLACKIFIYSLGLSIKSFIIFILPLLVFMILFKTIAQLSSRATLAIALILTALCLSNFFSTMISYLIGSATHSLNLSYALPDRGLELMTFWSLTLPKWVRNDHAMAAAIVAALLCSWLRPSLAKTLSHYFDRGSRGLLRLITTLIPLFVAGFFMKLIHEGTIVKAFMDYFFIFLWVGGALLVYITLIYLFLSGFRMARFWASLKNMLPAAITGLSSMSSAAAMPLTLLGAEKNSTSPHLTQLTVPLTVNAHLIGDCFAIPLFAFAVMKSFGMAFPDFSSYLLFALYFVVAKFSVAAIPGGGILVMLPILESQLGFTPEMGALITALYILFEPIITCANICGNGGFAMAINKLYLLMKRGKEEKNSPSIVHEVKSSGS